MSTSSVGQPSATTALFPSATSTGTAAASSASSTSASSSSGTSGATFGDNFSTFLTLLTSQLKNQDPLSPLDTNQFTSQLVQFSSVEQLIKENSQLGNLISLQQASQNAAAVSYLGKNVEVNGNSLPLLGGSADFSYTLQNQAQSVAIAITDQNGNLVRTLPGATDTTRHDVTWDGKDNNGNTVPDGVYNFTVVAADAKNQAINSTTTFKGPVTRVSGTGDTLKLTVGGKDISLSDIVAVASSTASASN